MTILATQPYVLIATSTSNASYTGVEPRHGRAW